MGLFHRKQKFDDIDLPPPPPPSSELPPIPPVQDSSDDLELPPLPSLDSSEQQGFDQKYDEMELPPLPSLDGSEKDEDMPEDVPGAQEPNYDEKVIEPFEERKIPTLKEVRQKRIVEGPLFVNVSSYKDVITNVNLVREKIRETEAYAEKLNDIKNTKDKYFEQLRAKLEDLQRKSLYVDKVLFE